MTNIKRRGFVTTFGTDDVQGDADAFPAKHGPAKRLACRSAAVLLLATLAGCFGGGDDSPASNTPPVNPYLSAATYAVTHVDSSASDSGPYGPPPGVYQVDPTRVPVTYGGPTNIMTLAATDPDYMWGVGTDHVAYVARKAGAWTQVAFLDAPAYLDPSLGPVPAASQKAFGDATAVGMTVSTMDASLTGLYGAKYPMRMANAGYTVVDRDNVLYANFGNGVYAFGLVNAADPSKGLRILRQIDDVSVIAGAGNRIFGLNMTFDGHLVMAFKSGVAVLDRSLAAGSAHYYGFGAGESVSNGISVDENNGIYIASDTTMRKLVWTGSTVSDKEADGAWSSPYDTTSEVAPVVKFEAGTGSTPTLMGFGSDADKLVVITDGSKQMKLVAFWRDRIPADFAQKPGTRSRRIADQVAVTCGFAPLPEWIQSEQSVVVRGYGAFVVNNIPTDTTVLSQVGTNKLLVVALMGPAYPTSFGTQRFQWDPVARAWTSVWSRPDVSSTSMVPVHSQSRNAVLVNGYTNQRGWEVTGLDWDTGKTYHQTIFGYSNWGNGAYALVQYLDNGDLLFNAFSGVLRVHCP